MRTGILKIAALLGLTILFALGCSGPEGVESDADVDEVDAEDDVEEVDDGPPPSWPVGYVPHDQSDDCLDRYNEYYPNISEWQSAITPQIAAFGGRPRCTRIEDGLGGYCMSEEEEGVEDHYFHFCCHDPEWSDPDSGVSHAAEEACIWLMKAVEVQGACQFDIVCVPENRLVEFNWPADADFSYRVNYDLIYCSDAVCLQ